MQSASFELSELHRGRHQAPAISPPAHELFENQPANEKRKLLDFVLSNSVWKNGKLLAEYRQPFDVLAVAAASDQRTRSAQPTRAVGNEHWLPGMDSNHELDRFF